MNVFVSYSWQDAPIRCAVVGALSELGKVNVLFDHKVLVPSESIHKGVSTMLDKADVILCLLTPSALDSKEVLDELSRAHERKKTILPLVDQAIQLAELPHFLRDTLQIRFSARTIDAALNELRGAVLKLRHGDPIESLGSGSVVRFGRNEGDAQLLQRSNLGRNILEHVIEMCAIHRFSHTDRHGAILDVPVFVAPNTFVPDVWTTSFLRGLAIAIPFKTSTIVEIGVGSGVVPIALKKAGIDFERFFGYDIDNLAVKVARLNTRFHQIADRVAVSGGGTMFTPEDPELSGKKYADFIIANIPQVPSMTTGPLRDLFDYYPMPVNLSGREKEWAARGLWLVASLLRDGASRLKDGGKVVLNLGGRPGERYIERMIGECGYTCDIVHREIVAQDPETDISTLVHFEQNGINPYVFYSDPEGHVQISAHNAYERVVAGDECFHSLLVCVAEPK